MLYALAIIDYLALLMMFGCLFIISMQKASFSQKNMTYLGFFSLMILLGFCIKIGAESLESLLIGQKLIYFSAQHALFFLFLFILNYCHREIPDWAKLLLITNNCIMGIFVLFMEKHDYFYISSDFSIVNINGINILNRTYGPLHTIYFLELIAYSVAIIVMLILYTIKQTNSRKSTSILLMFTILCPLLPYFIQQFLNLPYELTPIGFIMATILMLYLIYVEKIYDISDIARDFIFESMDAAIIMTDENYYFKGCNRLAENIFPELRDIALEQNIYAISSQIRQIINGSSDKINFEGHVYEPSLRKIVKNKTAMGNVIWLSDVTTQIEFMALQDSYREELEAEIEKQTAYAKQRHKKIEQMSIQLVQTLANTIDAKDKYTNGHSTRVAEYSVKIAEALDWEKEAIETLRYEGLLHDIGKIGIPDTILNKPSHLNDSEFNIIQSHTIMGSNIMQDTSSLPGAENVIRHHHERYDGTGYPLHLKGEQIPLDARIVGIADSYDAMSSNRVYRKALPKSVIREELLKGRGTQFDPFLLDVFINLFDKGALDSIAPADNGWND